MIIVFGFKIKVFSFDLKEESLKLFPSSIQYVISKLDWFSRLCTPVKSTEKMYWSRFWACVVDAHWPKSYAITWKWLPVKQWIHFSQHHNPPKWLIVLPEANPLGPVRFGKPKGTILSNCFISLLCLGSQQEVSQLGPQKLSTGMSKNAGNVGTHRETF